MLDKGFTSERCPLPSLRYAPRPLRWRKVVRMAANLWFASNPSHACGRGARSCLSERPTPPQPSPSLREREGATAVVPSHARQGLYQRTLPSPQPPLRAPALALAQGRSNGCEPLVRKQPLSRMRERGLSGSGGQRPDAYFFSTGLPSASITVTSPRFKARIGASVCFRSPTTTQVNFDGSRVLAASATCAGVIASISALRLNT